MSDRSAETWFLERSLGVKAGKCLGIFSSNKQVRSGSCKSLSENLILLFKFINHNKKQSIHHS